MTERRVGGTEAAEMLQKAAETLAVGDRIELRWIKPFSLDDAGSHPAEPEYTWEPVEIIEILPKATTASYVLVRVRHADGTTSTESLARPWRALAS
jgi:hypothetical protein